MSGVLARSIRFRIAPVFNITKQSNVHHGAPGIVRFSTESGSENLTDGEKKNDQKISGFAKAFQKYTNLKDVETPQEHHTFASLLRNSKFIDLGDPEGKVVTGEIFKIIDDDLYIDFGWKFHCVCNKPNKNPEEYVRGAKVRLLIKDLELSSRFLGSDTDLTLLEADCKLLNVVYSPVRKSHLAI